MTANAMPASALRNLTNSSPKLLGLIDQSQVSDESHPDRQGSLNIEPYNLRSWPNLRELIYSAESVCSNEVVDRLSETTPITPTPAGLPSTSTPGYWAKSPNNAVNGREEFVNIPIEEARKGAATKRDTQAFSQRIRANTASSPRGAESSSLRKRVRPGTDFESQGGRLGPFPPRSLSLNDLECTVQSSCKHPFPGKQRFPSSSSEGLRMQTLPSYPLRPTHPPPLRRPTPPGLPAFNTTEAQELRLTPSSRPEWFDALLTRLWRLGETSEENGHIRNTEIVTSQTTSPPEVSRSPAVDTREGLKRLLGMPRIVTHPIDRTAPQRVSLPRGVRVASVPGALIRADDGSMVRGRFPHRASGHGIGPRPIDAHPFYQRNRTGDYEQAVGDREKDARNLEASNIQHDSRASPNELTRMHSNNQASSLATVTGSAGETFANSPALDFERQSNDAFEVERRFPTGVTSSVQGSQTGISHNVNHGDPSSTVFPGQPSATLSYSGQFEPPNLTNLPTRSRPLRDRRTRAPQSLLPSLMREPRQYGITSSPRSMDQGTTRGPDEVLRAPNREAEIQQVRRKETWNEVCDVC